MATTAALTENSRQGINPQIPPCVGLETRLSPNLRWGCGHAYDETPVGLVVYVRNDPVNLVDPDGNEWKWLVITAGLQGQDNESSGQWMWFDEDLTLGPSELTPVMIIRWDFESDDSGYGDKIKVFMEPTSGFGGSPGRVSSTIVCRGCLGPWMNPNHPERGAIRDVTMQHALIVIPIARSVGVIARNLGSGLINAVRENAWGIY